MWPQRLSMSTPQPHAGACDTPTYVHGAPEIGAGVPGRGAGAAARTALLRNGGANGTDLISELPGCRAGAPAQQRAPRCCVTAAPTAQISPRNNTNCLRATEPEKGNRDLGAAAAAAARAHRALRYQHPQLANPPRPSPDSSPRPNLDFRPANFPRIPVGDVK